MNRLLNDIGGWPRTRALVRVITPYIPSGSVVLDIGAGACQIARTLDGKRDVKVTAIDTVDHNLTDFPLQLYDGHRLPFRKSMYDVGLLIFVLHHAEDITALLQDAGEVCKRLIIIEDTPLRRWERVLWRKMDYLENHAQHADVNIAHEALTPEEWREKFGAEGFRIVASRPLRSFATTGFVYPHTVFVLERR